MAEAFMALVRLRHDWPQDPPWASTYREPHLQVCAACREALLTDLESRFTPIHGPHRMTLEASQVLGFTFSEGSLETCALHPFLHAEDAHG